MASKNFSGILRDPLGTLASNDKYRFTHVSTTGEVIRGSTSYLTIGDDGVYNIDIEYGNVSIESYSELGKRWIAQGTTTINADTTVTTLPALLNALVPASDALILQLEAILADAESAADRAESVVAGLGTAANRDVATTAEAIAGTSNKLPDTVGVKAAIDDELNSRARGKIAKLLIDGDDILLDSGDYYWNSVQGSINHPAGKSGLWHISHSKRTVGGGETQLWTPEDKSFGERFYRVRLNVSSWSALIYIYDSNNLIHAQNLSGATVASTALISGANLNPAKTGTWRNVSGNNIFNTGYGLWELV